MQHRMKQYQCDQCDFMASKLRRLKQHKVSAQEAESLFLCGNCGYRALSPHILKVHQSSKHDGVECRCPMCDCTTNWSADLTTHRRKKHMQPWAISTEPQETCRSSYSGGESLNVCRERPNRGGGRGVSKGGEKPNCFFSKSISQGVFRSILGPPKHVLHLVYLVWRPICIYSCF